MRPYSRLLSGCVFTLVSCCASPTSAPEANVAQLTSCTESYRDCAFRRHQAIPPLDSCASITVKWLTVKGKPGINKHLYRHVLSWADASAPGLSIPPTMSAALKQVLRADSGFADKKFSVELIQNGHGLLTLQNRWYYDGDGAHPSEGIQFYNYSLQRDRLLTLNDLLVVGYRVRLAALGKQAFYKQNAGNGMLNEPAQFHLTNNFLITFYGLRFYYNAGQMGAVAGGPAELLLSWKQLAPLLRPDAAVQVGIAE